jgi:hypothetical protein
MFQSINQIYSSSTATDKQMTLFIPGAPETTDPQTCHLQRVRKSFFHEGTPRLSLLYLSPGPQGELCAVSLLPKGLLYKEQCGAAYRWCTRE